MSVRETGKSGGTAETVFFALSRSAWGVFYLGVIVMKCPFCNGVMEKGLLQAGNMIVWVKKKHYVSLLPKEGEVLLARDYWTGATLPSWICRQCRKVITEYEESKEIEF